MTSTIQLTEKTKCELKQLKQKSSESYEHVISRLIKSNQTQNLNESLKKGYQESAKELKQLNEEWENADSSW